MDEHHLVFLSSSGNAGVHAASPHNDRRHHHNKKQRYGFRPTKLFVFGDSYADTGNVQKSVGSSWKEPYGITFPGKPAGRFSDGRVLTDYVGNASASAFSLSLFTAQVHMVYVSFAWLENYYYHGVFYSCTIAWSGMGSVIILPHFIFRFLFFGA